MIGGHLPRELGKQLRILAAEEDTTVVALLEEAITDLLTKKAARQARR
jgi:predicted transcriptional regulator